MLLIKNARIKTMAGAELENGCILVDDNGKIARIAECIDAPVNAAVVDAGGRLTTPGCVEAHCHIGLHNACLRWEGADYNETTNDPVTPHMRAIDSIYPMDEYFTEAIRGGVTTACTGPGSANVVGGTFAAIKLAGNRIDDMIVKAPAAMKCALGENPKGAFGQDKKSPKTRMGSAAVLRELLFKAKAYCEETDAGEQPKFDMKLEAMLPVMRGDIPLKCHAHRADDILTAIRIAKEFGVKLTLDHCTDGACIADILAEEGYPVIVGPALTSKSKPELASKHFKTPGILHQAGNKVCITTDAPVSTLNYLPLCAGLAASEGLPMDAAWEAITINPATVLGIADRVGSLEPGKDADIVIWTADPLTTVGGRAYIAIIDGKIVYQE